MSNFITRTHRLHRLHPTPHFFSRVYIPNIPARIKIQAEASPPPTQKKNTHMRKNIIVHELLLWNHSEINDSCNMKFVQNLIFKKYNHKDYPSNLWLFPDLMIMNDNCHVILDRNT